MSTACTAHALVGAAWLELPSIERMLRVKQIPPEDAAYVSLAANVTGTVTLVDRRGTRTILRLRGLRLAP